MPKHIGDTGGGVPTNISQSQAQMYPSGPSYSNDEGPPPVSKDIGKINVDLTDVLGTAIGAGQNVAGFVGRAPVIGNVLGGVGDVLGAVGGVELPYLRPSAESVKDIPIAKNIFRDDPNVTAGHLGDFPGMVGNVLGTPVHLLESGAARGRLLAAQHGIDLDLADLLPFAGVSSSLQKMANENYAKLPDDIRRRLDEGESIDSLSEDLLARGAGFSSDPVVNFAGQLVLDPMNFLGGAVIGRAQDAAKAIETAQELNKLDRALGTAYSAGVKGMSVLGQTSYRAVFGPATSGVIHGLGAAQYSNLRTVISRIDPDYGNRFSDDFGRGIAQMDRAVIGNEMGRDATAQIASRGENIGVGLEARLNTQRLANPGMLSRDAEDLIRRRSPTFLGYTAEELVTESARKLSAITGMSLNDAERTLQGIGKSEAKIIHLAYYGHIGHDLEQAKAAATAVTRGAGKRSSIDIERLTLLAPDTLHMDRAQELLAIFEHPNNAAQLAADEAVEKYSVLSEHFLGKSYGIDDVKRVIQKLADEEALPTAVKAPVSGRNKLPGPLSEFRQRAADTGYELGFQPEDGWKAIVDEDGNIISSDPFIAWSDEIKPAQVANPLGQFTDSIFRGINQTTILYDSRDRFVNFLFDKGTGVSPQQARSIHREILNMAADRASSTRGLAWHPADIETAFRKVLNDEEFATLREQVSPTYALMHAFEGSFSKVGLTQKITGRVKTITTVGDKSAVAAITDAVYPSVKFKFNPLFQSQELVESPFFNLMRGITSKTVSPDMQRVIDELLSVPEYRFLGEAGSALNVAGGMAVQGTMGNSSRLGKALGRLPDVKGFKNQQRAMQIMAEHGEHFRDAVLAVEPKLWDKMVDAYKTTDPSAIAARYFGEHLDYVRQGTPVSWRLDDVGRAMEAARPPGFGVTTTTEGHLLWDQQRVSDAFQQEWGLPLEQSDALAALAEARALTWSTQTGRPAADWYATHLADITRGGPPGVLYQQAMERITRLVGDDVGMTKRLIAPNDEKTMLSRLNRVVNLDEAKYVPQKGVQQRLTWKNSAGRQVVHYVGGSINFSQWREMVESTMTAEQIHPAGRWYDDFAEAIRYAFPDDADNVLMAFAATQNAEGVTRGMQIATELYRARQSGVHPGAITTEVIQRAVLSGLNGIPPSYKNAPKLSDFFDSFTGKLTRTFVGDDARGFRPAAIDRHTIRDLGFVDPATAGRIAKMTGGTRVLDEEGKLVGVVVDGKTISFDMKENGKFGPTTYDYGLRRMNSITDEANAANWMGRSDWQPREIQAIGWARIQHATDDLPEGMAEAMDPITSQLRFEMVPDGQLGRLYPDVAELEPKARAAIGAGIADFIRTEIAPRVGAGVRGTKTGEGVRGEGISLDVLGSDEALDDMLDTIGSVFGLDRVESKMVPVGRARADATHVGAMIVGRDPVDVLPKLLQADPGLLDGAHVVDGQLELVVPSGDRERLAGIIHEALGPDAAFDLTPVKSRIAENDWSTPGNAYQERLHKAGRPGLAAGRDHHHLRAAAVRRLDALFAEHAPDAVAAHHAGLGPDDLAALRAHRQPAVEYARFGRDPRGNALLPAGYTPEPGYVFRTVDRRRVANDWRPGEYVARSPATIYAASDDALILRTSENAAEFTPAKGGVGAGDNLQAKTAIPASQVEVLGQDGQWYPASGVTLYQASGGAGVVRGSTEFLSDGRAILRALTNPDVSTGAHELFHVFRRDLSDESAEAVQQALGIEDGVWTVEAEEQWARWGERFLREGKVDIPSLQPVFKQFRDWMVTIYRRLKGTPLEKDIPPEVRQAMNGLFEGADSVTVGRPPTLAEMADSMDPAEVLRLRKKAGFPGDLPFDDYRISTKGERLADQPYVQRPRQTGPPANAELFQEATPGPEELSTQAIQSAFKYAYGRTTAKDLEQRAGQGWVNLPEEANQKVIDQAQQALIDSGDRPEWVLDWSKTRVGHMLKVRWEGDVPYPDEPLRDLTSNLTGAEPLSTGAKEGEPLKRFTALTPEGIDLEAANRAEAHKNTSGYYWNKANKKRLETARKWLASRETEAPVAAAAAEAAPPTAVYRGITDPAHAAATKKLDDIRYQMIQIDRKNPRYAGLEQQEKAALAEFQATKPAAEMARNVSTGGVFPSRAEAKKWADAVTAKTGRKTTLEKSPVSGSKDYTVVETIPPGEQPTIYDVKARTIESIGNAPSVTEQVAEEAVKAAPAKATAARGAKKALLATAIADPERVVLNSHGVPFYIDDQGALQNLWDARPKAGTPERKAFDALLAKRKPPKGSPYDYVQQEADRFKAAQGVQQEAPTGVVPDEVDALMARERDLKAQLTGEQAKAPTRTSFPKGAPGEKAYTEAYSEWSGGSQAIKRELMAVQEQRRAAIESQRLGPRPPRGYHGPAREPGGMGVPETNPNLHPSYIPDQALTIGAEDAYTAAGTLYVPESEWRFNTTAEAKTELAEIEEQLRYQRKWLAYDEQAAGFKGKGKLAKPAANPPAHWTPEDIKAWEGMTPTERRYNYRNNSGYEHAVRRAAQGSPVVKEAEAAIARGELPAGRFEPGPTMAARLERGGGPPDPNALPGAPEPGSMPAPAENDNVTEAAGTLVGPGEGVAPKSPGAQEVPPPAGEQPGMASAEAIPPEPEPALSPEAQQAAKDQVADEGLEVIKKAPGRLDAPPPPAKPPTTVGTTPPTRLYNADEETVWQAFKTSLREESAVSFKTHYFNTSRSWFERTVNHPYLGLYPASYMWGKVLPEFARFLLMRPFGLRAPLVGMLAVTRIQQRVSELMAEDDNFVSYMADHPDLVYLFEQLIPALPTNLPANFPAYARHISQDVQAGRKVTPETITREIGDTSGYALGPLRSLQVGVPAINDVLGMGGDLLTNLTKSAAAYDGQVQQMTGQPQLPFQFQQGVPTAPAPPKPGIDLPTR